MKVLSKMGLNGWQRMWVFISVLYLVAVSIVGFVLYKDASLGFSESEQQIHNDAFYEAECPGILLRYPIGSVIDELAREEKRKLALCMVIDETRMRVAEKRVKIVQISVVLWLAPVVVLYLLGLGVMWVRRGFGKR